jgi:ABC-2 type transport system permease protein
MNATAMTPAVPTIQAWLARVVSDVAVITRRNLLFTLRLPQVLVLSSIMPVIFIVMFT